MNNQLDEVREQISLKVNTYRGYLGDRLSKNPDDIHALIQSAILEFVYFYEHDIAVERFEKAIALEPQNVEAMFWLASCHVRDFANFSKAKEILDKLLDISPHHPEGLNLMARVMSECDVPVRVCIDTAKQAIDLRPHWPVLNS